jgi:hypothetical protein
MTLVSGSLTPTGATTDVNIDDLFSVMLDPAAYNASGSTFSTTGTIELGGTTLSLDFTSDFAIGQGIYISDSSTSAPPLLTTVVSVASLSLVFGTGQFYRSEDPTR